MTGLLLAAAADALTDAPFDQSGIVDSSSGQWGPIVDASSATGVVVIVVGIVIIWAFGSAMLPHWPRTLWRASGAMLVISGALWLLGDLCSWNDTPFTRSSLWAAMATMAAGSVALRNYLRTIAEPFLARSGARLDDERPS